MCVCVYFCVVQRAGQKCSKNAGQKSKKQNKNATSHQTENSPDKTDLKWNTRRQITEVTT